MRRFHLLFALGVLCGGLAAARAERAAAATAPAVTSIIEGRDTESGRTTLVLVGRGVSKLRAFTLTDTAGTNAGAVEVTFRAATMVALRLPAAVTSGEFDLVAGVGAHGAETHRIALAGTTGVVRGSITAADLSPAPAASLADATTLCGRAAGDFALASQAVARTGGVMIGPLTVTTSRNSLVAVTTSASDVAISGKAASTAGTAIGVGGRSDASDGSGVLGFAAALGGTGVGARGLSASDGGAGVCATMSGSGPGSAALAASHDAATGNVAVFQSARANVARIDRTGRGFFDGGTATSGADFAGSVAVGRPKDEFEPGDVIVIDAAGRRRFALSRDAESSLDGTRGKIEVLITIR